MNKKTKQTEIRLIELDSGELFLKISASEVHFFFLFSGEVEVNYNSCTARRIKEGVFFLIPWSADFYCQVQCRSEVLLMSYEDPLAGIEGNYLQELYASYGNGIVCDFVPVSIAPSLENILRCLVYYVGKRYRRTSEQLILLLRCLYNEHTLVSLLHPILGTKKVLLS